MSAEQREVHDSIAATHGGKVGGPFAVWLHSPDIASAADQFRNALRPVPLDARLYQLLVLLVARHWAAAYPWSVHVRTVAQQELFSEDQLDRILAGERPDFEHEDEERMYSLVTELMSTGSLSDTTFAHSKSFFGERLTVEIVTIAGFYTSACLIANVFAIPPVPDVAPSLRGSA
jgi:4-carboxymuconolactone decarboxylase